MSLPYLLAAAALLGVGLHGMAWAPTALGRLLAVNVMGTGVFLLLVLLATRPPAPDPVPQAMVLTGIVVAAAATGFGVTLLRRLDGWDDR